MRTRAPKHLLVLSSLILFGAASLPLSGSASELRRTAIVRAVENARPSIVNIQGRKSVPPAQAAAERARQVNGMGTGVIIDDRGYVVTNFHVVEGVARIQVTLEDGRSVIGALLAHDSDTDLALLKIDVGEKLPVVPLGRSNDLMIGEPVIAVGNAFGYEHTVTRGIISALHRTVQVSDHQEYHNLIQTDASINPGNSGGPLLNIDGDMIGINVAVRVGAQGIGFAIPIDEAIEIMADLISIEQIKRMRHGVVGSTTVEDKALRFQVRQVLTGTPAGSSGLQVGDVITEVDGSPVARRLDFEKALLDRAVGEKVNLVVSRQGVEKELTLVIEEEREATPRDVAWSSLGLQLSPMPAAEFRRRSTRYRGGLKVASVRADGPAAKQGIRPGDVLVGMHEWETVSLDNVSYILNRSDLDTLEPIKFYILRGSDTLYGYMRFARR